MQSTSLACLLARMDFWQTISTIEEKLKVRALDEALRTLRRDTVFPWTIQKNNLRVFRNVLEYPVASDHDELAMLDNEKETFEERGRFRFTSMKEFYEDIDYRNDLAEIWQSGSKLLGVRYSNDSKLSETLVDNSETAANWTASGGASSPVLDEVVYKEGNGSIRFTLTSGTAATMTLAFTSISDSNYKRKYFFAWVYLDTVPTSIDIRFGNDSSNYLSQNKTTQFSGAAFVADTWNLIAIDLNLADLTGSITDSAFDYAAIIINGAASGTFYIDACYLRGWQNLDYRYYSIYNIALVGSSTANQEYFLNSNEVYSTDSSLIGDSEWADCVMYKACELLLMDKENERVFNKMATYRQEAWNKLEEKYPNLIPTETTQKMRFLTDVTKELF